MTDDRRSDDEVIASSGNIFADVDLPDAEERLRKAHLAIAIKNAIREEDLTQTEAAERMGMQQPDVSRIVRGRLSGFTFERLLCALVSLGRSVDVFVSERRDEPEAHFLVHLSRPPEADSREPNALAA
jgi:predicted XRE-type DNA-binding protein